MQATPSRNCHYPPAQAGGDRLTGDAVDRITIPVIVNSRAGSGSAGNRDADAIADAFNQRGLQVRMLVPAPGESIGDIVDRLVDGGATLVVAAGGDGTANAVASRLVDRDVSFGILPQGTLNHFARDAGIPFDLDAAVEVIAAGHCRLCDVGDVNGHLFLNNSGIGLYPRIVSERERDQRRRGAGKWPAMLRATWDVLRHPSSIDVAVCVDGETLHRRTPFVFVGNNGYISEGLGLGRRTRLDDGVLSLYILRRKSALGFLWLALRSLLGIGSRARDFDAFGTTEVEVRLPQQEIEVSTDGEVLRLACPVRYGIRPRALRVLAPPPAGDGGPR
jgi:diacylglycerol kinase family enzyme